MTTGQNSMAASSTCGLMTANRGRGGNVPVAREILPPALGAGSLDAHHRIFGIGEVAEAGALRALEIFRHVLPLYQPTRPGIGASASIITNGRPRRANHRPSGPAKR